MFFNKKISYLVAFFSFFSLPIFGQQTNSAPKQPDVLIFTNGDKLTGQFERSTGNSVMFKSDMTGEFTVDWSKVTELHSSSSFAVIPKGVKLGHRRNVANVPQGDISVADQKIEIKPQGAPTQIVPTGNAAYVVDESTFHNAIERSPGFLHAWTGAIAAGVDLVEATQKSNTFSGSVGLVRITPTVSWLDPRDRTSIDFNFAYGKLTQPGSPQIKTDIYHAGAERDEYFSPRLFGFGQAAFDHNFSQGLDLQQTYGGGVGLTAIKNANEELDLKASMDYIRQQFIVSALNQNLIGSNFAEIYRRQLPRKILFTEGLTVTPAWNNLDAYSAIANAGVALPVYKRFSLSMNAIDNFLNNPPPGFKKNSFQFTTGLSYTLP
jgi:hypothetical protein